MQLLHWQGVFFVTGTLGVLLAIAIFLFVKDAPRGGAEPALEGIKELSKYRFNWPTALSLFKKRSLLLLFVQGFFGSFPWQVITFWFFRYLETERNFSTGQVTITMIIAVIALAAGYPIGGALGDALFKKNIRGRLIVASFGVIAGELMLWLSLSIPHPNIMLFTISMSITAIFIPSARRTSYRQCMTLPYPKQSNCQCNQNLVEQGGSALPCIGRLDCGQLLAGKFDFNHLCRRLAALFLVLFWRYLLASRDIQETRRILSDGLKKNASCRARAMGPALN